ncbi:MAG: SoxR reducing system RseC family protein [bacterium]|jgi:positive regulator of sigma E activity|nr:SoxR reducing system RseC family protein [bacterium]
MAWMPAKDRSADRELQVEEGVVREIQPGPPLLALVQLAAGPACEECGARLFCRPADAGRRSLLAEAEGVELQVGQRVRVAVTGGRLLSASLWSYGYPLAGLCLGTGLGWHLSAGLPGREALSFLAGLLLAALPLYILHVRSRRRPGQTWLQARVLPTLPTGSDRRT